jgi:hypothetical protein
MSGDPWSRPTLEDLQRVLESIEKSPGEHVREAERLELSVPAEITTRRGNVISAMTREISRLGIGMLHKGAVSPGEVTVRMASETREFEYRVLIEWCHPCENGMFLSGGRFLRKRSESNKSQETEDES